ncbi:hypothetical protein [Methylocella sp.]|uniref:hypothetical protein n=1 Tax=Methylocella sp. TaxID=1978226 RepID=UPI003782DCD4
MSKLTAEQRKNLPDSAFAGPGRTYPVEDKAHARDAKARAAQAEHSGRISAKTAKNIDEKADRVLKKD